MGKFGKISVINLIFLKIFMHNFYFLWTFWDSNIFIFLYASSICWTAREGGQVPGLRTVQRVQSRDPLPPPPPPRAPPGPGPWLISIPHISYVSKLNINDGNSNYSQCYLRITHYLIVSVSSSIPNNGVKGQRIRIISHRCVKLVGPFSTIYRNVMATLFMGFHHTRIQTWIGPTNPTLIVWLTLNLIVHDGNIIWLWIFEETSFWNLWGSNCIFIDVF